MSKSSVAIERRRKFAEFYFKDPSSAGKAYMQVFPSCKKTSAWAQGSRWLKDPVVIQRLSELEEKAQEVAEANLEIDLDRILSEEACIAFLNPKDLYDENNNLKAIRDLPDEVARAISEIRETSVAGGITRRTLKFHAKGAALDRLETIMGFKKEPIGDTIINNLTQILVSIDGQNRGKLPHEVG